MEGAREEERALPAAPAGARDDERADDILGQPKRKKGEQENVKLNEGKRTAATTSRTTTARSTAAQSTVPISGLAALATLAPSLAALAQNSLAVALRAPARSEAP